MRSISITLFVLFATGCYCNMELGVVDRDAAVDAAARPGRTESCGNGMDDDRNGRIDDGCPCAPGESQACFGGDYPSRNVGTCRDGVQTCAARPGQEWGDWGDYPCEGDQRPVEEMCDGRDHDCDGMRDEGCPCVAGATRDCGGEFPPVPPCRAGTQACDQDGRWSATCQGAVGPSAEVCADGVDNDCDGMADPPALCDCVPTPEICADGIDNDCDGVVDEPMACSATCVPVTEICGDGVDQDCDGSDRACTPTCVAPRLLRPVSTSYVTTHRPTLRWAASPGATSYTVRLCRDRACTTEIARLTTGATEIRPSAALSPGVVFWNVTGSDGCASATWELFVRARDTSVDSAWGTVLDVDGDGLADMAVGSPTVAPPDGTVSAGRVYVYHGVPSGYPSALSTTLVSPWPHETTTATQAEKFGRSVQSAGDVDGDGFGDLIVGAPFVAVNPARTDCAGCFFGRAWIFLGGPSGVAPRPAFALESGADPTDGSATAEGWFGTNVAGLGDLDGDGYGDVGVSSTRRMHIFYGGPAGTTLRRVALSGLYDMTSLAPAGDVNGDGFADVLTGEVSGPSYDGRGFVFFGGPSGVATSPSQVLVATGLSGVGIGMHTACAGDVDGDGYGDVALAGTGVATSSTPGYVVVFYGGPTGLLARPFTATQTMASERLFGNLLVGGGDLDGDGYDDLLVSRVMAGLQLGYILRGSPTGPPARVSAEGSLMNAFRQPPLMMSFEGDGRVEVAGSGTATVTFFAWDGSTLAPRGGWTAPAFDTLAPLRIPSNGSGNRI
jgi:hypothetical protein